MIKVLLVEDDLVVQRVHQLMLNKLECSVDIAANGKETLQYVDLPVTYQIIFVDIGLPDISGFDLIKKLRSLAKLTETPIIALTGYCGPQEKITCLESGATDVCYKPIVFNSLRMLLERFGLTASIN